MGKKIHRHVLALTGYAYRVYALKLSYIKLKWSKEEKSAYQGTVL